MTSAKPVAMHRPHDQPALFQRTVIAWFREEGKPYPWRQTTDPYAILVSEIMLQQTQIGTVLERDYFARWMARFPDLATLAAAPEEMVLKAWEGLGYYSRARNLHRLGKVVCQDHGGRLPQTLEGLLALPGIGRYTAAAVMSFAHDHPAALVDGNVQRVFARLHDYPEAVDGSAGQKQMWAWAAALVPDKNARFYNSGLMELGQGICRQKAPICHSCPVAHFCQTRNPEVLPNKAKRRATVFLDEHVLFRIQESCLLLIREAGRRRHGLWKLPECPGNLVKRGRLLYQAKYSITHHRVTLRVYESKGATVPAEGSWVPIAEVPALAMPSPYRKAVDVLLEPSGGREPL